MKSVTEHGVGIIRSKCGGDREGFGNAPRLLCPMAHECPACARGVHNCPLACDCIVSFLFFFILGLY